MFELLLFQMWKTDQKLTEIMGTSRKASFQQLITQEELENLGNRLNILYVVFYELSNDANHFCYK